MLPRKPAGYQADVTVVVMVTMLVMAVVGMEMVINDIDGDGISSMPAIGTWVCSDVGCWKR